MWCYDVNHLFFSVTDNCELCVMILLQIQVLDRNTWPVDVTSPWIDGENKLRVLCQKLRINYHVAQAGFRDFDARCDSRDIPVKLRELSLAIQTIPVTSADAERGFSSMILICSQQRNRLTVQRTSTVSSSVLSVYRWWIFLHGHVQKWLVNHRAASDNQSKKIAKTNTDDTRIWTYVSSFSLNHPSLSNFWWRSIMDGNTVLWYTLAYTYQQTLIFVFTDDETLNFLPQKTSFSVKKKTLKTTFSKVDFQNFGG